MTNIKPRKKVGLSTESAVDLMQEIYTEIVDERHRALQTFKKFSRNTDENTDIAMVGKITNDLLKIVDASIEKKIRLLKIQTDILYKGSKGGDESEANYTMGEKEAKAVHDEIKSIMSQAHKVNNEEDTPQYD